jgi:glycosyltransferase involved in cell wall biosynthesis
VGWWLHWEIDWGMLATAAAWIMAKGSSPELIWVSAPHFRSLPVATRLAAALSIPLVVDLRDPWTYGSLWHPKTSAIARAERRWASRALGAASRIVFTSPLTLEAMHERFPELERSRLVTLTNGFDDAPIEPLREQPAERCLFRYVGMLNERRHPDPLIVAFARAAQDPQFRERAVLEFVGNAGGHERKAALAPGCHIEFRGHVSRAESLRLMAGSDVNILLQTIADGQDVVSGKAFDYLHARRPILAAVDEAGGDAWLVRETGAGSVVPWSDPEAIARELLECFRRHAEGRLQLPATDIERFSRRRLTAGLARLFDDVVQGVVER